jgi:hypothetical protein
MFELKYTKTFTNLLVLQSLTASLSFNIIKVFPRSNHIFFQSRLNSLKKFKVKAKLVQQKRTMEEEAEHSKHGLNNAIQHVGMLKIFSTQSSNNSPNM